MTAKRIALVAHDARKDEMVEWTQTYQQKLAKHTLFGTGTTAGRIHAATGLEVTSLLSGPLGGDQQLGAMIATEDLDILVFFIDPLSAMPHDVDVRALVRVSTLHNLVFATNQATANLILDSL